MRIIRNTPDQLVISQKPWVFALLTGGFAAAFALFAIDTLLKGNPQGLIFIAPVLVSGLVFAALFRSVRVIFDLPSNSVEIITAWIHRRDRVTHRLDELSRIFVQSRRTSKGFYQSQLQLRIVEGESTGFHEISSYKSGPHHSKTAKIINLWLDSTRSPA